MLVHTAATVRTFVLRITFTKLCTVMAGDTDGGSLTTGHLLRICSLIIFFAVTAQIVGVTVIVVIVISKTGFQPSLECCQVHGIGIKDILVFDFRVIPAFRDMNLIGIGFGILPALLLAKDIAVTIIVDVIGVAIIAVV